MEERKIRTEPYPMQWFETNDRVRLGYFDSEAGGAVRDVEGKEIKDLLILVSCFLLRFALSCGAALLVLEAFCILVVSMGEMQEICVRRRSRALEVF